MHVAIAGGSQDRRATTSKPCDKVITDRVRAIHPKIESICIAWNRRDVLADRVGGLGKDRVTIARVRRVGCVAAGDKQPSINRARVPSGEIAGFEPAVW